MARPLISVISMQQNEARNVDLWYRHAKMFADEIVIGAVGERPTNKYPDIRYVDYHAETVHAKGMNWVKNELIKHASGQWIVLLDGDEIMATDRKTLQDVIADPGPVAFATNTHDSVGPVTDSVEEIIKYPVRFSGLCHYRIFKNIPGMHCIGVIHEEMYYCGGPIRNIGVPTIEHIGMIHLGTCLERPHRHTVYGELMARSHDLPSLRTASHGDYWARQFADREAYYREGQRIFWEQRGEFNFDPVFHPEKAYGTHWDILERTIKAFDCKRILELGCGHSSTPRLHAMGLDVNSYETDPAYCRLFPQAKHVDSYDHVPDGKYDLVFIDNAPVARRNVDIGRFRESICVVHDTEETQYDYWKTIGKMKYCYTDPTQRPWTSVCSDVVDVNEAWLGHGFKTYVPVDWRW